MTADQHTNLRGFEVKTSGFARRFYFACAAITVLFVSCASHPVIQLAEPEVISDTSAFIPAQFNWQNVACGVSYAYCSFPSFPVRYRAVRIDLTAPGLEITSFPSSEADFKKENGKLTPLFTGRRTASFAKQNGTTVAINTSPFAGKNGQWNTIAKLTRTRRIIGTHIAAGKELAEPVSSYAALVLKKQAEQSGSEWTAEVIDSQTAESLAGADYAFGGFFTVLRDGERKTFSWTSEDSRSGAGVSKDGKTLYLLIVEGENSFQSRGLSFPECAAIFAAMGADDALEFDGGGSSCLCINGRSVMSYPVLRTNAASAGFIVPKKPVFIDDKP